jgi:tetratricopeptide (TPR) repeat protein
MEERDELAALLRDFQIEEEEEKEEEKESLPIQKEEPPHKIQKKIVPIFVFTLFSFLLLYLIHHKYNLSERYLERALTMLPQGELIIAHHYLNLALINALSDKYRVETTLKFVDFTQKEGFNYSAEEAIKLALKYLPKNNYLATKLKVKLAETYIKAGKLSKAYEELKELRYAGINYAPLFYLLAELNLYKGNLNKAKSYLFKFFFPICKRGEEKEGLKLLQKIYAKEENWIKVLEIQIQTFKKKRIILDSDLLKEAFEHLLYTKEGNYRIWNKIFSTTPYLLKVKEEELLLYPAVAAYKMNKLKEAENILLYLTQRNKDCTEAYYYLGKINLDKNSVLVALKYFKAATRGNSFYPYLYLAEIYGFHLGNYEKAKNIYLKIKDKIRKPEERQKLSYNLGIVYYKLRKYKEAVKEWNKFSAGKDNKIFTSSLANAYLLAGELSEAESIYSDIIKGYKEEEEKGSLKNQLWKKEDYLTLSSAFNNLGYIKYKKGEKDAALNCFWQAIEYAALGEAENNTAYLNLQRNFKELSLEKDSIQQELYIKHQRIG